MDLREIILRIKNNNTILIVRNVMIYIFVYLTQFMCTRHASNYKLNIYFKKIKIKIHVVCLRPQFSLWTSYFISKMDVQKDQIRTTMGHTSWDKRLRRLKAVVKWQSMGGLFQVQDGTELIGTSGHPRDRRWMGVCYHCDCKKMKSF